MPTAKEVKEQFRERGETQSDWARRHGYRPNQVSRVLNGHDACIYGDAYAIAVLLGLKAGTNPKVQSKAK